MLGQKPTRCSSHGKTRNMGNVGITYQNVYHAWLAMFLPPVVVYINDIAVAGSIGDIAIPTRMAPVLIVIALIILKLVLQVSHNPE